MKKIIVFTLLFTILFASCGLLSNSQTKSHKEAVLTSIYISQLPEKTNYAYEEPLDLTGLEVKARYTDGSEKIVDGWSSSPSPWTNMKISGTIIITITYSGKSTNFTITVAKKSSSPETTAADKYFWGTWVRMDNGAEYEVLESSVVQNNKSYNITSSENGVLKVSGLGTFKKESDRVMVNSNIPYFRKGGTNLEYSLKIVSFGDGASRAAGTPVGGMKGRAKSTKYAVESESQSDDEGLINFTAPTSKRPAGNHNHKRRGNCCNTGTEHHQQRRLYGNCCPCWKRRLQPENHWQNQRRPKGKRLPVRKQSKILQDEGNNHEHNKKQVFYFCLHD